MFSLYRRHEESCRFKAKGVRHIQCLCPVWMEGRDEYGKRQRRSLKTRSWSHAQVRLNAIETGTEPAAAPQTRTTAAAVANYLADCRVRKLRPATIRNYTDALAHVAAAFPGQVAGIDLDRLTRFRAGRDVAAASAQREITILRTFLTFCVDRKWIPENPASKLKPPKSDRLPTMPFAPDEIARILAACDRLKNPIVDKRWRSRLRARALVTMLLYSGLRISDVVQLRRGDLDISTGQLLLRIMKTREPLYIRLPRVAVDALQALPVESPQYFLWNGDCDLTTTINSSRRTIRTLMELANVEGGHPHRFRDTFSVTLLKSGVDIRTVQLLLGHTSIRTTERHYAPYVISMQTALDSAVANLSFGA